MGEDACGQVLPSIKKKKKAKALKFTSILSCGWFTEMVIRIAQTKRGIPVRSHREPGRVK